jgi:iron complex transport system ATP-binding protein
LLQVADLGFAYTDEPVLAGVNLRVRAGTTIGILGPNGSGKSTLLRLLSGTLTPRTGHVTLDGRTVHALPRQHVAERLAVVPQETHPVFDYTVLEIALMGRYPHLGPFELEDAVDVAIARRALAATGTLAFERRRFDTLSGGEKQRVAIASALAQFGDRDQDSGVRNQESGVGNQGRRRVLLLDEPTASLDLHYQIEVAALLRRLNRETGLTIVVSTHDLNFAASVCEELVLLREGRVIAAGPTADVLTPAAIRDLYGVDADVRYHEGAGHLTVIPLALTR